MLSRASLIRSSIPEAFVPKSNSEFEPKDFSQKNKIQITLLLDAWLGEEQEILFNTEQPEEELF
jgi:hypothetical protein